MRLDEIAAEWRGALRSVAPADRDGAERGLEALYRASGWRPARRVRWFDSPPAAARAIAELREPALFAPGVEHAESPEVRAAFDAGAWSQLRRLFSRRSRDRIKRLLDDQPREAAGMVKAALARPGCGQHDAMWVGAFDAGKRVFGVEQPRALDGWAALARSCGWWWAFRDTAIACERQRHIGLDDLDRPHAVDGPALAFADGFALHAIHGVRVDAWMVEEPERLTPDVISEQRNSEVRRVLIDRYGTERYLGERHAVVIAEDAYGTLYRLDTAHGGAPLVLVKVRNATPEPDGSVKDYFLRVPPWMSTPHAAVAWTFGMDASAYAPLVQT